jgi:hypothetical protein
MSKALVAIVGPSGSGKSSSLENLNPETTRVIDVERKGMPFRNPNRFTTSEVSNPKMFDDALQKYLDDTTVELIVIESFTKYAEIVKTLCATAYKGFEIWSSYAKMIRTTLNKCKNNHAAVVWTAIDEIVPIDNPDGTQTARRLISVDGKELRGKIEAEFLLVFFTDPRKNATTGKMEYRFATNTDGVTSAKTPKDMFPEPYIPNDLAEALKRAKTYFTS